MKVLKKKKQKLLLSLGINFNLEPVVDVSTNENDFIYSRSLGQESIITSQYAKKVIKVMNKENISGSLKHFQDMEVILILILK